MYSLHNSTCTLSCDNALHMMVSINLIFIIIIIASKQTVLVLFDVLVSLLNIFYAYIFTCTMIIVCYFKMIAAFNVKHFLKGDKGFKFCLLQQLSKCTVFLLVYVFMYIPLKKISLPVKLFHLLFLFNSTVII